MYYNDWKSRLFVFAMVFSQLRVHIDYKELKSRPFVFAICVLTLGGRAGTNVSDTVSVASVGRLANR